MTHPRPQQGALFALAPKSTSPPRRSSTKRTLAAARADLRDQLDSGVTCPCCGQYARRYRRKLNSGMGLALVALVRIHRDTDDWVHLTQINEWIRTHGAREGKRSSNPCGDFAKLRYWSLVDERPPDDDDDDTKRKQGWWKPSTLGVLFACGRQSVPSHALVYNGTAEGLDGDWITIEHALGAAFDYNELMGARP